MRRRSINGRTAGIAVTRFQLLPHKGKADLLFDQPQQMSLSNLIFQAEVIEQRFGGVHPIERQLGAECIVGEKVRREKALDFSGCNSTALPGEQETEPSQTGLRRRRESLVNSHREAKTTAPSRLYSPLQSLTERHLYSRHA